MLKCSCCGYEEYRDKWSIIDIHSSDGYTSVTGKIYDLKRQERIHIGSVTLFACPKCKTVTFDK